MPRKPMSSAAEIAVHTEQIEQLERSRDNLEESMGGIMKELSDMRSEMAEKLGKICAKLDAPTKSIVASSNGNGAGLKMGALIATITALAQVIVELAKAVISMH